jgi:oligopeptide transport system permease protein
MIALVGERLGGIVTVLLAVTVATFVLMHQAPGGPWDAKKPVSGTTRRALDARFGLDRPLWINLTALQERWNGGARSPLELTTALFDSQFVRYLTGLLRWDFGPSYKARGSERVQDIIAARFPVSAKLGAIAILFAVGVGLPLGILGALRTGSWLDRGIIALATVVVSVPAFVPAVLLLIALRVWLDVSPLRQPEEWQSFGSAYLLPGMVLGLGTMAYLARLTRDSLLEAREQDYVRTARAKGLSEPRVLRGHVLRNALIPIVTVLGPAAIDLATGSFVIETIFAAPGLGKTFVVAIGARDYPLIMGTTLFYALLIALANATVDITYAALDPRLRGAQRLSTP